MTAAPKHATLPVPEGTKSAEEQAREFNATAYEAWRAELRAKHAKLLEQIHIQNLGEDVEG